MNDNREAELEEKLSSLQRSETAKLMVELLQIRRENWRTKLEGQESDQVRGRAKECKDLIQIFS